MTHYSKSELRLQDPQVQQAIRVLQARGVTLEEIEVAYRNWDKLKRRHEERKHAKTTP